jgi:hypothetical protein
MKRKKKKSKRENLLPAEVTPPTALPQASPSPETLPGDVRIIDVSLTSKPDETPTDLNFPGLIAFVTSSEERTANLARLIWSTTGLLALGIGSISGFGIVALHYGVVGRVGLTASAIAEIMSVAAWIRLRKKRDSD